MSGVMIHHTAGLNGMVGYCYNGSSDLPGPLCHGVIDKAGVVHLVGNGRANHAGGGDPKVLAAVVAEDYGDKPPATHEHEGSAGAVDGNAHFYGFECVNLGDGHDPWPDVQLEAMVRAAAALCRAHGWSARSVIGHLEWSNWKSDPRGFTMTGFRAAVAERLGATPAAADPAPSKPSVSLAHVVAAARKDPGAAQGHTTHRAEVLLVEKALHAEGLLASTWVDGSFGSKTITAYASWQRSPAGGGFTGSDADGIPGKTSLKLLAARHGFQVVA
ncbi:N-acetylmuramoyl-L-alanine amidase [Streptomyces sp. NPDC048342]|uniref:N-acetylmuramoyl-L-alanine amidase n=1 Tax=unclassified Streptomyces TaxID=2593676 RepID=UPI00343E0C25